MFKLLKTILGTDHLVLVERLVSSRRLLYTVQCSVVIISNEQMI